MTRVKNTVVQRVALKRLKPGNKVPRHNAMMNKAHEEDEEVKKRHWKKGTVALREIRQLQKNSTHLLIPRKSFRRLCQELMQDKYNMTQNAAYCLQEGAECYLQQVFKNAQDICCNISKDITVNSSHLQFAAALGFLDLQNEKKMNAHVFFRPGEKLES